MSSWADAHSDAGEVASRVQYSRLTESVNGRYSLEHVEQDQGDAGNCFKLQVIGERVGNETCFTVYCDGREFSTREHESSLFAVVSEHVLAQRRKGQVYPIYVTDIDLSALADQQSQEHGLRTIHYLQYKKRIEYWLIRCMEKQTRSHASVWGPAAPD